MAEPISIHRRGYDTEVFADDDDTMRVVGRLTDTKPVGLSLMDGEPIVIHDMTVELSVRMPGFEIVKVEADMHVHPYAQCPQIVADYQQLVGLSIGRGYTRKVRELFGGPSGCSHIGALLIAMAPVAIQASWAFVQLHDDPLELAQREFNPETTGRQMQLNTNTCHMWREDGDQMASVKLGQRPVRPMWEAARLEELQHRAGPES